MSQIYHSNARTNVNIRMQIQNKNVSNQELAERYTISPQTVSKWKARDFTLDKSSRPHHIKYALTEIEKSLIVAVRKASWLPLDEIYEMIYEKNTTISRSSVYRCLVTEHLNKVPQEQKEKAQLFKEYEPGYLHIDVTYLPKFESKNYLYVAIDRATRALYYEVYESKTAQNTEDFMCKCLAFFPFGITHVLTDNGLEFTNYLIKSKTGNLCKKPSKLDELCAKNSIEHRLTKPATPKTNGMVERVNGTIKNNTILKLNYSTKQEMIVDLAKFMCYYILHRRHGGLRKELKVKTPMQAIEKWYELKPQLFNKTPTEFKNNLLLLQQDLIKENQ